jgi:putative ABC transport system substrate-binding protein
VGAEAGDTQVQPHVWEAFKGGLRSDGWTPGRNVDVVYANVRGTGYPDAAAELVRRRVDVIWADSAPAVRAAFAATRSIPIIAQDFTTDPVAEGYAESYGRPGKNVTGIFLDAPEFSGKWLELLKAIIPSLSRAVVLWDPSPGAAHRRAVQDIAPTFGINLQVLEVRTPEDIDAAASAVRGRPQALIILPSPLMYVQSPRLAKLADKLRLPAISMARAFAQEGGLISHGPDLVAAYGRAGALAAKILRGADPSELPIERPAVITLVVNLKAARALNLAIPESVLARVDAVIR